MHKQIKSKIMLHYVLPGALGGPNVSFSRIENSPILKEKYEFVRLNQNRVAGGKINISLIFELRKQIKKEKPDLIHISGMQSAGFHCMVAALLAGCKKRIISTRGFSGDALNISQFKRFIFNNIIEPLTLVLATNVQGISKYTTQKKMVKRYAKKKSCYIYNFPPNNVLNKESNILRKELNLKEDDIVFTTISRVTLDKGYAQLADAINAFKDYTNIKFIIVGDGDYLETFKESVLDEINSKKVFVLGKRSDVMDILSGSDVFLLPTLHENLGNVFLEASMSKIPSIATNVGGVPEIVIDNQTGYLVPPYNSSALIEAIDRMYKNDQRKIMGNKAHDRVLKIFDCNSIAQQFDQLYTSVLSNKTKVFCIKK